MKKSTVILLSLAAFIFAACQTQTQKKMITAQAPVAKKVESSQEMHGTQIIDNYRWMQDKTNPEVIAHLELENAYADSVMINTVAFQETLFNEMKSRLKEEDETVPVQRGEYFYYSKLEPGKQYRLYFRKKGSLEAQPELLLDANQLAEGKSYLSIGAFSVSPDQKLLAYSVDNDGSENFTLFIKNLETGEVMPQSIPDISYSFAWANDNKTVFFTKRDKALRPFKVFKYTVGSAANSITEIYHEKDDRFFVGVSRSSNDKYIFIGLGSQVTSEYWTLPADQPNGKFQLFAPRIQGVEYNIQAHEGRFIIHTNQNAVNFKLMETPENATAWANWKELVPHNPDVKLESFQVFKNFLTYIKREAGLRKLIVSDLTAGTTETVSFPDPSYTMSYGGNVNYDTDKVRYNYSSLVRPNSTFDYNMTAKTSQLLKEDEVVGGYNADNYVSERIFATAPDGTKVPISLVYKKGLKKNGNNPTLLYGYGSYSIPTEPNFSPNRLSLLDRGFVYAIAHIRGSSDMGEQWYQDGKLMKKKNTFTDFIACAEELIAQKYTSTPKLGILGGSAGGLLMGAVTNMRPDLFGAVIAKVPFVDMMNTMLDPNLPLTVIEYEEWGNPNEKEAFEYMLSYSPNNNIKAVAYPHILATAGLNDPRVSYWEPAKWVQLIREVKTNDSYVIFKTNMGAGHGGSSGRYDYLKDIALDYAFLMEMLNVKY